MDIKKTDAKKGILADIWGSRRLIFQLAKNDFKTRYAGSFMGIFWAFIQPVITILVYWFVFEKGLRAGSQAMGNTNVPFVLFLISGLVPWFFFSDALPNGTSCLISYSYLVKKVVFKIEILPIVKVIASIFVHLFFMCITIIIFWLYGFPPDLYTLQIIYYSLAVFVFTLGLSYLTSALVVFIRDLAEIINIVLQILVWATPIMWNIETALTSPALKSILQLNPMFYIVNGYRSALVYKTWFWEEPMQLGIFAGMYLIMLIAAVWSYKKLIREIPDVL